MTLRRQHVLTENDVRVWHEPLEPPDNRPLRGGRLHGVPLRTATSAGADDGIDQPAGLAKEPLQAFRTVARVERQVAIDGERPGQ